MINTDQFEVCISLDLMSKSWDFGFCVLETFLTFFFLLQSLCGFFYRFSLNFLDLTNVFSSNFDVSLWFSKYLATIEILPNYKSFRKHISFSHLELDFHALFCCSKCQNDYSTYLQQSQPPQALFSKNHFLQQLQVFRTHVSTPPSPLWTLITHLSHHWVGF